jgi:hypothetical protein
LSNGDLLITRLTVFFDTPARRATSLIVGFPRPDPPTFALSAKRSVSVRD